MLRLVWRHLLAHPARSLLTAGSVAVAVALLLILRACLIGLESAVTNAATNRLWVQSAVSLYVDLPRSYQAKMQQLDGVDSVCKFQWFGGVYQDESNFFAQFGVDPDVLERCYPEMEIVDGDFAAFTGNRAGCVVGEPLAKKHGWSVGDTVPILGSIYPHPDGGAWEFVVEAIYRATSTSLDPNTFFFDFGMMDQVFDAVGQSLDVGAYVVRLSDGYEPEVVQRAIDGLFYEGPQRVQATTEAEFSRQFVSMLGNVPLMLSGIGGAVLFAIFFAVLNTMLAAGRERIRTVGIVKAIGFSNGYVYRALIAEAVVICLIGGVLGVGLAFLSEAPLSAGLAGTIQSFEIPADLAALGLGISLAIGVIAGIAPCLSAGRVTPVRAFRMGV